MSRAYLEQRQRAPAPWTSDRQPRRRNSLGGAVAPRWRTTTGAQQQLVQGDPRYFGATNDGLIVRDRTPVTNVEQRSGVGTGEVDWTACGPYRPITSMRNVTVRRMAGTSQTRNFADPRDRTVGLHSRTTSRPRGNLMQTKAGAATMRGARTDRLYPAGHTGRSYSQTTLLQGAKR